MRDSGALPLSEHLHHFDAQSLTAHHGWERIAVNTFKDGLR